MQTLNLTGNWTLRSADGKHQLPARVPGDNISALLAAKQIPDPYWADNEIRLQWIGRADWVYERQFRVSQAQFAEQSIFLNCDGLDTLATIFMNGRRVTRSENMFTRLRVEVKPFLRVGLNTIRIVIASAEVGAAAEARRLPYPIPHGTNPVQSMHRNLIRKVQCHSGWDWGPCLMVSGINGSLYLGATSRGRIEYVATTQQHRRNRVTV